VSLATPVGAEDRVVPWQPLAGALASAGGLQLAAKDEAQRCLGQSQLSFVKDRFRLTCEGRLSEGGEGCSELCLPPAELTLSVVLEGEITSWLVV